MIFLCLDIKINTVNNLRLWQAKACSDFSFKDFNAGDYVAAVSSKTDSETISKVLYPNDSYVEGKFLRLKAAILFRFSNFAGYHQKV